MIWIFGLATGLIFDLPTAYWVSGFLFAMLASIID